MANQSSIIINGREKTYLNGKLVESDRSASSIDLRETGSVHQLIREAMDRRTAEYGPLTINGRKGETQQQQGNYSYEAFVAQCKLDVGVPLSEAERETLKAGKPVSSDYAKFVESLKEL